MINSVKPKPPLCRMIQYGFGLSGFCKSCGSTLKVGILSRKEKGCIHPKCENHHGKGAVNGR